MAIGGGYRRAIAESYCYSSYMHIMLQWLADPAEFDWQRLSLLYEEVL
jgi:hypothetical protein